MSAAVEVSICVDCSTTIIGEQPRCPACHQRHAVALVTSLGEDDVTVPRPRAAGEDMPDFLARWIVAIELLVVASFGLAIAARGCLP